MPQTDFGYRQVGIGIQFDGFYGLSSINGIVYGFRYIYFIPRNTINNYQKKYKFTIGYIVDFLLAYRNNWRKKHGIETGYSIESRFRANIQPYNEYIIKQSNYLISSFYFVYKYEFLIKNIENNLLFNIAYGFDNAPNKFSIKHAITAWAAWSINF